MRRTPILRSLLLAALLWLAQVQGVMHGISHLGVPDGRHELNSGTHTLVCSDCAAYAQAGVAPLPVPPAVELSTLADPAAAPGAPLRLAVAASVSYQSRAPPVAYV